MQFLRSAFEGQRTHTGRKGNHAGLSLPRLHDTERITVANFQRELHRNPVMSDTMRTVVFAAGMMITACAFAGEKQTDAGNFTLALHITAIDVQQGTRGVHGYGNASSSHVSGGQSYLWSLYTVRIDGDSHIYGIAHKRGPALAMGDYKARWSKPRELKIQYSDEKGRLKEETFVVLSEHASDTSSAK